MATKKAIPRNSSVPQKAKARSSTTGPAGRKPTRSSKVLPHPSIPGSLHEARLLAETVKAQVTHHEKYWMENVQQLLDKVREDVGHRKSPADKGEVSQPKYMTLDWLLKTEAGRRQFDHGVSGQEIEWLLQAVRKDKQDTTKEVAVLLVQVLSDVGRMAWMFGMLDGLASLPAVTSHTALEAVFRHRGQGKGSEQRDKSGEIRQRRQHVFQLSQNILKGDKGGDTRGTKIAKELARREKVGADRISGWNYQLAAYYENAVKNDLAHIRHHPDEFQTPQATGNVTKENSV